MRELSQISFEFVAHFKRSKLCRSFLMNINRRNRCLFSSLSSPRSSIAMAPVLWVCAGKSWRFALETIRLSPILFLARQSHALCPLGPVDWLSSVRDAASIYSIPILRDLCDPRMISPAMYFKRLFATYVFVLLGDLGEISLLYVFIYY